MSDGVDDVVICCGIGDFDGCLVGADYNLDRSVIDEKNVRPEAIGDLVGADVGSGVDGLAVGKGVKEKVCFLAAGALVGDGGCCFS